MFRFVVLDLRERICPCRGQPGQPGVEPATACCGPENQGCLRRQALQAAGWLISQDSLPAAVASALPWA